MDLLKNLDNMITAEEFLDNKIPEFENLFNGNVWLNIEQTMIEFAKLHVEAAKKEYHKVLVKQGIVTNAGIGYFDNAYPLELIK